MKQIWKRCLCLVSALVLTLSMVSWTASAEVTDPDVLAVIQQLESIDTLQQMQNRRSANKVKSRYLATTTNTTIITKHENARTEYETYLATMFAAREAAQRAYDELTAAQKAQIDPALVAKLDNELGTVFTSVTATVTPRSDEYSFETVDRPEGGLCYESSNHLTLGPEIPATFVIVDTADGKTTWTPDGPYVSGESNYEVTYCCDLLTGLEYGHHYKRVNLEDSTYFNEASAKQIRAIILNSYPFVSMEEMKANLKRVGIDGEFVDSLTRSDAIAATQMAIWAYANAYDDEVAANTKYGASFDVTANSDRYMNPLHDYTNELWTWWTTSAAQYSYDARAEYRVNMLVYYLTRLEGIPAQQENVVVSNVEVTRADLTPGGDGSYTVGMYIHLNNGGTKSDSLKIKVTSYHTNADGSTTRTDWSGGGVYGETKIPMTVRAYPGDTIKVTVDGMQTLGRDVYFYEPEGGRGTSQSLVGMGEGRAYVYAEEEFTFREEPGEMGLRIYKTNKETGTPINDITFDIYKVVPGEGEVTDAKPTAEELAKFQVAENLVATLVTDKTGYAAVALDEGIYLVVERSHEKIKEPADPFYVWIPMLVEKEDEAGNTITETVKIVSVYPKNEPNVPPPPPPPPPPEEFSGRFQIRKVDADDPTVTLEGATFAVYRAATEEDQNPVIVTCNGTACAVVPVIYEGAELTLTTGQDGIATSPDLDCEIYFVLEIKAPLGYKLKEDAVTVTVVPDTISTSTIVEVTNEKGSLMPETGGIGTVIFTTVGGILVLMAMTVLVMKKRGQYIEIDD